MLTVNKALVVDIESYNDDLKDKGPQFIYGLDHVVGIGILTDTGDSKYFPLKHKVGENVDPGPILRWLKYTLTDPNITMIAHNAPFDIEALWSLGLKVSCKVADTMALYALIDEEAPSYRLSNIAWFLGVTPKKTDLIENALPKKRGKPDWQRIDEVDPIIVSEYCLGDCQTTMEVYKQELLEIEAQELGKVAQLESDLVPILWEMRLRGVRVDLDAAELENQALKGFTEPLLTEIYKQYPDLDLWSSTQLGRICVGLGEQPPETDLGNYSVTGEYLAASKHPILWAIGNYRKLEKLRRDFVAGVVLEGSHNGRIHPSYFSTRGVGYLSDSDTGGTRSGRLSCAYPNLQQSPVRHPEFGKLIRSLFLPEEGTQWGSFDYSSQEPRWSIHYAAVCKLEGAHAFRKLYQENPKTDFHATTMGLVNGVSRTPITRNQAKTIGLGLNYGMGKAKLARSLKLPADQAAYLIGAFHQAVPFMGDLLRHCASWAERRGFVKTLLGRRRRFDSWEPNLYRKGAFPVRGYGPASEKYGTDIRKSGLHKAANSVIQGTSAEQMKSAIVAVYKEGLPILATIHDELAISISSPSQVDTVADIMAHILPCTVPHLVEGTTGANWGSKKG